MAVTDAKQGQPEAHAATRQRLQKLAWWLDSSIPIPGTRFRIGLDSLIGLLPGVGDAIGALLSSYLLAEAARLNVPRSVILQMGLNVLIDTLVGMVPILGDFFDMAWKANQRNIRLLERYSDNPSAVTTSSRLIVLGVALVAGVLVILIAVLGFMLLEAVWTRITA